MSDDRNPPPTAPPAPPAAPPKKKPPRASWEPPDPEEVAPPSTQLPAPPVPEPLPSPPVVPLATSEPTGSEPPDLGLASPAAPELTADGDEPLAPLHSYPTQLPEPPRAPSHHRPATDQRDDDHDSDDDDSVRPRRSRKLLMVALAALVVGLIVGTFIVLGAIHSRDYAIACEADAIVAVRGRSFPPWGTTSLDDGAMWKPIKIPPEAECLSDSTDDLDELSARFLSKLEDRANALLATRDSAKTDEAAGVLEQALLHTRAPERRDTRARIERLLGDVTYWRASAKLRDAASALTDAAKQFDAAAGQRPRHVSDAAAWADHVRRVVEQLRGGPGGAVTTSFPPTPPSGPPTPPAPVGTALPVEPLDAGTGAHDEPIPPAPNIPSSGVLL